MEFAGAKLLTLVMNAVPAGTYISATSAHRVFFWREGDFLLSPGHVLDSLDFSSNLCLPLYVAQLIGNFTDNYNYYNYLEIIIEIHTQTMVPSLYVCVVFFLGRLSEVCGLWAVWGGSETALSYVTEH